MHVDVWSDVVCPWCYIGKARFEQALSGFAHREEVSVRFHSYQLDPGLPRGSSEPLREVLARTFTAVAPADLAAMEDRVAGSARAHGLGYRTDRLSGNTFDLHRLLHLAADAGRQAEALTALNQAYFADARAVFDPEVAAAVFTAAGLDPADVERVLAGDDYTEAVLADQRAARDLGITGVPFFVVDGRFGISGAQPADLFTEALTRAWPADSPVS